MADINQHYPRPFQKAEAFFNVDYPAASGLVHIIDIYQANSTVVIDNFQFQYTPFCFAPDDAIWQWELQRQPFNYSNDFDTVSGGTIVIGTTNQEYKLGVGMFCNVFNTTTSRVQQFDKMKISPFQMHKGDNLVLKVMRFISLATYETYASGLVSFNIIH